MKNDRNGLKARWGQGGGGVFRKRFLTPVLTVLAVVGGEPILQRHLDYALKSTVGVRVEDLNEQQLARLQATTLEQLVQQQIVLDFLKRRGVAASQTRVDVEVQRLQKRAASLGKSFQDVLAAKNLDGEQLRRNLRWQLSWQDYLDQHLTDDNLQEIFKRDRQRYDGSRFRIAHLLIKPGPNPTEAAWDAARQQAEQLRKQLESDPQQWEELVARFSQAASQSDGGDIGWVSHDGTLAPPFIEAVLQLERPGQISQPVRTPFGVHLIKCLQIEPGQRSWQECRDQLKKQGTRQLFDWVVERHRPQVEIEYTGESPYFDPADGSLQRPGDN